MGGHPALGADVRSLNVPAILFLVSRRSEPPLPPPPINYSDDSKTGGGADWSRGWINTSEQEGLEVYSRKFKRIFGNLSRDDDFLINFSSLNFSIPRGF